MEDGTLQLQDGLQTIFLSTKGENDSEVSQDLIQFLKNVGADVKKSQEISSNSYVSRLQRAVDKVKKTGKVSGVEEFQEKLAQPGPESKVTV